MNHVQNHVMICPSPAKIFDKQRHDQTAANVKLGGSYLLELLNGSLVDAATFVDQVS